MFLECLRQYAALIAGCLSSAIDDFTAALNFFLLRLGHCGKVSPLIQVVNNMHCSLIIFLEYALIVQVLYKPLIALQPLFLL